MKKLVKVLASAAIIASITVAAAIPAGATYLVMGDINKDSYVTLRDATLAQRIQLGLVSATADQQYVGDMDKNGSVTLADAYMIQRVATKEAALLEDHDGVENSGFCPNREQRVAFYEALNAERKSKGLAEVEYNDAMLDAGQELCIQWQREREDPLNTNQDMYSQTRPADYAGSPGKLAETVFADYGIKNTGQAQIHFSHSQPYKGAAYFETMKEDVEENGSKSDYYVVYNDNLMNPNYTIFLIGEKKTNSVASWIIMGSAKGTD